MLDSRPMILHSAQMDLLSLCTALADHFGSDPEIISPEGESDAWRAIADVCRDGAYPGLQAELAQLLHRTDQDILEFLRSWAPARKCEDNRSARRRVEVLYDYIETHASGTA